MDTLINSWESTKSYKTKANLLNALDKLNLLNVPGVLIVKVPMNDRWTAIFPKSGLGDNFMRAVWLGFKVLG